MHKKEVSSVSQRGRFQIPLPIRCQLGFGARNSVAGSLRKSNPSDCSTIDFRHCKDTFWTPKDAFPLPTGEMRRGEPWPDLAASSW